MSVPTVKRSNSTPTGKPPQRHRHTRRNVIIAIVAALILLPLLALGLLYMGLVENEMNQPTVGDAYTATEAYYQALQQQNYETAYTYLDPHATITVDGRPVVVDSSTALATVARNVQQLHGPIAGYGPVDGNFEQGKYVVVVTMRVIRAGGEYDVHIRIEWVGGNQLLVDKTKWRILSADGL